MAFIEPMHRNKPNITYLLTLSLSLSLNSDIFLGYCPIAFPFHVVDDFIPENKSQEKCSLEIISTFWCNISLSLEELMPVMVSH